jgi:hypothetical protein
LRGFRSGTGVDSFGFPLEAPLALSGEPGADFDVWT